MQIETNLIFNEKDNRTHIIPILKSVSFNLHVFVYRHTGTVKTFTSTDYEWLGNKILELNKTYYLNEKNMIFHCNSFSFLTYIFENIVRVNLLLRLKNHTPNHLNTFSGFCHGPLILQTYNNTFWYNIILTAFFIKIKHF